MKKKSTLPEMSQREIKAIDNLRWRNLVLRKALEAVLDFPGINEVRKTAHEALEREQDVITEEGR